MSHSEIIQAVRDLKDNKGCDVDCIYSEHLKLFVHGILPEFMLYLCCTCTYF